MRALSLTRILLLSFLLPANVLAERPMMVFTCVMTGEEPEFFELQDLYRQAFDVLGYDSRLQISGSKRAAGW